MDLHTWFAFFVASWIIAVSPGSGAVLSMSHGLSYGVRKTSATIMGLQLGLLLILLIAGAGVGSLLMASEWAFNAVKIVGACYLIYLGISQWRSGGSPLATHLHLARTVARRAEREAIRLVEAGEAVTPEAVRYLNRLSDHLFVAARRANANGQGDVKWRPGATR